MDPMEDISTKFKLKDSTQGIGFGLGSTSLTVPGFTRAKISITAICEMWGTYNDRLVIKVLNSKTTFYITIYVNVIGIPIKLYTGKVAETSNNNNIENDDLVSMIRFGSQIQGNGTIVRKLKLQNLSWMPLKIEWNIYIVNKDTKKLIDVNLDFDGEKDNDNNNDDNDVNREEESNSKENNSSVDNYNKINNDSKRHSCDTNNYSDANYIYVDFTPIIKLNLTPYYGDKIEETIYSLDKNEMFLKPRERTNIEVSFNTNYEVCGEYNVVFVGYFKLEDRYLKGHGYQRKTGFEKEPVLFKATGKINEPSLCVELDDDELTINSSIGDLLKTKNNYQVFQLLFLLLYLLSIKKNVFIK
jgi:hypothetical protein